MHDTLPLRSSKTLAIAAMGLFPLLASLTTAAQNMPSADEWQFEFIPYVWLSGINADMTPFPQHPVHIRSGTVLKTLDFAAMGTLEAHKGAWGGLLDMQYVKLGASNQFLGGLAGGYTFKYEQTLLTMAGLYRVVDSPAVQVEVLGGARYVDARTHLDVAPSLLGLGRQFDNSVGWWNGIVGVRAIMPVSDKWSLMGYLDGGDGNSTSSWQAIAGASYQYSPTVSLKFGYRYLSLKFDDQAFLNKVALGGFYAGVGFKF